jgi:hypothetical protein
MSKIFTVQNNVIGKIKYLTETWAGGVYSDIYCDGTYIFVACGTSGLRVYSFNGTSFTLIDTDYQGGTYNGVGGNGTYIFAACQEGLRAYSFNGSVLTHITLKQQWSEAYQLVTANNVGQVFGVETASIIGYTFNGTTFSTAKVRFISGNYFVGIWCNDTYILGAKENNGLYVHTFDGTTWTQIANITSSVPSNGVWSGGSYIYVATGERGIGVFSFNGSTLSLVMNRAQGTTPSDPLGIWGDGKYVYVAQDTFGLANYTQDSNVVPQDTNLWSVDNGINKITGDGTYIYAVKPSGLLAYKLYENYNT